MHAAARPHAVRRPFGSRRALAGLTALAIVGPTLALLPGLSAAPASAATATVTTYAGLESAFAGCTDGLEVTLGADVVGDTDGWALEVECAATVDLAGFDLTLDGLGLPAGKTVEVTDSTADKAGAGTFTSHAASSTTAGIRTTGATLLLSGTVDVDALGGLLSAGVGGGYNQPGGDLTTRDEATLAAESPQSSAVGGTAGGDVTIGAGTTVTATSPNGSVFGQGPGGTDFGHLTVEGTLVVPGTDTFIQVPDSDADAPEVVIAEGGTVRGELFDDEVVSSAVLRDDPITDTAGQVVNHGTIRLVDGAVRIGVLDHHYQVTYDVNGGEAPDGGYDAVVLQSATLADSGLALPADPTYAARVFTGWNTAADGSGTDVDADTTLPGASEDGDPAPVDLYAQWDYDGPTASLFNLRDALGTCAGTAGTPDELTLVRDLPAPSDADTGTDSGVVLSFTCDTVLDLAGFDLTTEAVAVADGVTVSVVDSGTGDPGTLTLDASTDGSGATTGATVDGTLALADDVTLDLAGTDAALAGAGALTVGANATVLLHGTALGTSVPTVTLDGTLRLARDTVATLGDGDTLTVGAAGRVTAGAGDGAAPQLSGAGTLANHGVVLPGVDVSVAVTDHAYAVTLDPGRGTLPGGSGTELTVYGPTVASTGQALATPTRTGYTWSGWLTGDDAVVTDDTALPGEAAGSPVAVPLTSTWTLDQPITSLAVLEEVLACADGAANEDADFGFFRAQRITVGADLGPDLGRTLVVGCPTLLDLDGYDVTVRDVVVSDAALLSVTDEQDKAQAGTLTADASGATGDVAGVSVPTSLIVDGTATLVARGAGSGAGIGGTRDEETGSVGVVGESTVVAAGGPDDAPGIGGADLSSLSIDGDSTVSATAGGDAPAVGGVAPTSTPYLNVGVGATLTVTGTEAIAPLADSYVHGTLVLGSGTDLVAPPTSSSLLRVSETGVVTGVADPAVPPRLVSTDGSTGYVVNDGAILLPTSSVQAPVRQHHYLVSFQSSHGTAPEPVTVFAGTFATGDRVLPPVPSRTGYAGYWSLTAGGEEFTDTTALPGASSDGTPVAVTLQVVWNLEEITTLPVLAEVLACDDGTTSQTRELAADLGSDPDLSLVVGCDTVLDLAGFDLAVHDVLIEPGVTFEITDSAATRAAAGTFAVDVSDVDDAVGVVTSDASLVVSGTAHLDVVAGGVTGWLTGGTGIGGYSDASGTHAFTDRAVVSIDAATAMRGGSGSEATTSGQARLEATVATVFAGVLTSSIGAGTELVLAPRPDQSDVTLYAHASARSTIHVDGTVSGADGVTAAVLLGHGTDEINLEIGETGRIAVPTTFTGLGPVVVANHGTIAQATIQPGSGNSGTSVRDHHYAVTLDAGAGTLPDGATSSHLVLAPTLAAAGVDGLPTPTRDGFTFTGWTLDGAPFGVDTELPGEATGPALALSVEAGWEYPGGPITSMPLLAEVLDCTGTADLALGADLADTDRSLTVGCDTTLDLQGFDLTARDVTVEPGVTLTVVDSGAGDRGVVTLANPAAQAVTLTGSALTVRDDVELVVSGLGGAISGAGGTLTTGAATVVTASGAVLAVAAPEATIGGRLDLAPGAAATVPSGTTLTVADGAVVQPADDTATTPTLAGAGTVANHGHILLPTSAVTVAAVTDRHHQVTFDLAGGSGTSPVVTTYAGSLADGGRTMPADPTRDGYVFDGWVDENGHAVRADTALTKVATGDPATYSWHATWRMAAGDGSAEALQAAAEACLDVTLTADRSFPGLVLDASHCDSWTLDVAGHTFQLGTLATGSGATLTSTGVGTGSLSVTGDLTYSTLSVTGSQDVALPRTTLRDGGTVTFGGDVTLRPGGSGTASVSLAPTSIVVAAGTLTLAAGVELYQDKELRVAADATIAPESATSSGRIIGRGTGSGGNTLTNYGTISLPDSSIATGMNICTTAPCRAYTLSLVSLRQTVPAELPAIRLFASTLSAGNRTLPTPEALVTTPTQAGYDFDCWGLDFRASSPCLGPDTEITSDLSPGARWTDTFLAEFSACQREGGDDWEYRATEDVARPRAVVTITTICAVYLDGHTVTLGQLIVKSSGLELQFNGGDFVVDASKVTGLRGPGIAIYTLITLTKPSGGGRLVASGTTGYDGIEVLEGGAFFVRGQQTVVGSIKGPVNVQRPVSTRTRPSPTASLVIGADATLRMAGSITMPKVVVERGATLTGARRNGTYRTPAIKGSGILVNRGTLDIPASKVSQHLTKRGQVNRVVLRGLKKTKKFTVYARTLGLADRALPKPKRLKRTFRGWWTKPVGGKRWKSKTRLRGKTVLHPHWRLKKRYR